MTHSIQNFDSLAENDLRREALAIAEAGYAAVNVKDALQRELHIENDELKIKEYAYPLAGRRIFFVGIGKCAFPAAQAIEEILNGSLTAGIAFGISCNEQIDSKLTMIKTYTGTHPLPSEENENATKKIFEFLSDLREDDLVLFLISGGGSTLICSYEPPMTFSDESILFKELTAHGATIQELNTVRKHTSHARGGGFARAAYPAESISLIVSDVPGDEIEFISSGPTIRDSSTIADAKLVLEKYGITPPAHTVFIETIKEEKYFERAAHTLFLAGRDALSAMQGEAIRRGYAVEIADKPFTGEARDVGRAIVEKLHTSPPKTALLYAGESTVTLGVHPKKGGRSQEIALAALENVLPDELVLSFSSDGHDNTDFAGAIGDNISRTHAREKNIPIDEYLAEHRSYDFFSATGGALVTGYTGSNVSDLIIALKN